MGHRIPDTEVDAHERVQWRSAEPCIRKKTVQNEKDIRLLSIVFRRLSVFGIFCRRLAFPASFRSIFLFWCLLVVFFFSWRLFADWGVFGCLWRPAAVRHNRISLKMAPECAPTSQATRLFVFFPACRLFMSDFFGVFLCRRRFRHLSFLASLFGAPFSVFSGVFVLGVFYLECRVTP